MQAVVTLVGTATACDGWVGNGRMPRRPPSSGVSREFPSNSLRGVQNIDPRSLSVPAMTWPSIALLVMVLIATVDGLLLGRTSHPHRTLGRWTCTGSALPPTAANGDSQRHPPSFWQWRSGHPTTSGSVANMQHGSRRSYSSVLPTRQLIAVIGPHIRKAVAEGEVSA